MKRNFLIVAPDYDENIGGIIALHNLCHLLNEIGEKAYITKLVQSYEISPLQMAGGTVKVFRRWLSYHRQARRQIRVSDELNTPILSKPSRIRNCDSWIVIYPEIVFGNPLAAKNVVRWLLHHPGYLFGDFAFSSNELHVRYKKWISPISIPNITNYPDVLTIFATPPCYGEGLPSEKRSGTAYCIRKAQGCKIIHDLTDSINIDGKSHEEIASILKSVKTFISYDCQTAYLLFAAVCGCDSVAIPMEGLSEDEWQPVEDRWGLAYGFDKIQWARETRPLLLSKLQRAQSDSINSTKAFATYCNNFFR
jgi:hypothetical protein